MQTQNTKIFSLFRQLELELYLSNSRITVRFEAIRNEFYIRVLNFKQPSLLLSYYI